LVGFHVNKFTPVPLTATNFLNTFIAMPSDWTVLFHDTLYEYVRLYIEAHGDPGARAQIIKDCHEDIITSTLHEEDSEVIELPEHFCWASISSH
jgi:hypothetical protein